MSDHDQIPILLERLARLTHADTHAEGLRPTQWEVLRYLDRANRFSQNPSALTQYLGLTKGTVSQTIQALERKGLIEKTASEHDRRVVRLRLTAKGVAVLARDPISSLYRALAETSPDERALIKRGLDRLLTNLLRARGGRPFGACKTCRFFDRDSGRGAPHFCCLLEEPLSADDAERICVEQSPA